MSRTVLYLLVGTIAWRFLGIIFENIGEVIAWERWEGTIEYTFMSPVPRFKQNAPHRHVNGATLVRATAFSIAILAAVTLFVARSTSRTRTFSSAVVLLAVGAHSHSLGSASHQASFTTAVDRERSSDGVHRPGRRAPGSLGRLLPDQRAARVDAGALHDLPGDLCDRRHAHGASGRR